MHDLWLRVHGQGAPSRASAPTGTSTSTSTPTLYGAAGIGAAMAIAVNGTVDASAHLPPLTATGHVSGTAMLTLAAGDVVTMRNNSLIALTMVLARPWSAPNST